MTLNILIVEDEAITAMDMQRKIEFWGYHVIDIAHSGQSALKSIENSVPDLILMDIILKGDMDGVDTVKKIKENYDIPIIYLTAHSEEKTMSRAQTTQPEGYLIKPLDDKELHFALESAVFKHESNAKLKKLNRSLRMISDCNQLIVRQRDQKKLLNEICELIVEEGSYRLAWIGIGQNDEFKSIKPVAQYGFDDGYLESLKISWEDNKYGQGPTGRAIRNSENSICLNIQDDPEFAIWREEALSRGYNSSIALPLIVENKTLGSLNIYSSEVDAFDSEELELLEELSTDISYALESLKNREERYKALQSLKESEERYRLLAENSKDMIYRMSIPDGKYEYVSPSSAEITGHTPREFYENPSLIKKLIHPSWNDYFQKEWEKLLKGDMAPFYEYQIINPDGTIKWINQRNSLIKDKNGHPKYIQGVATDISKRKRLEKDITRSEKRYRNIFENTLEGIYQSTPEGKYISVNPAFANMAGFESPEEMIDQVQDIGDLYVNPKHREEIKITLSTQGIIRDYEIEVLHQEGHKIWMSIYAKAIKDSGGNILYYEGTAQDITEKKLMQESLHESEEKYRNIVETANEGIWSIDKNYFTTFINHKMAQMLGYDYKEVLGKPVTDFMFEEDLEDHATRMKYLRDGFLDSYNQRFCRKDGGELWTLLSSTPLKDEKDDFAGAFAMLTDITDIKKKETHLKKALSEKELLLREINHRVNNNMQIITSLLNLQADYTDNPDSVHILTESQSRVKSMSFIYENLYKSENLLDINFFEYIKKLSFNLLYTYIPEKNRININFHGSELFLNIDTAIPCGLIINELVTNSLRHGFINGRSGEIDISLRQRDEYYYLTIDDNGVGFPENLNFRTSQTLGLQLVMSLLKQIDGEIELLDTDGTCFQVKFKEIYYPKRI